MTVSIHNLILDSIKSFKKAPLLFILFQIPQGMTDCLEIYLEKEWGDKEFWLMGLFAFLAFIIGIFPTSLTFSLVINEKKSFSHTLESLSLKWGKLLLSAFVSGILFAIGVMAYVVPGVLLMTFYLFVPYLILSEKEAPLTSYFYQSSQIAKKHFIKVILLVFSVLFSFILFQNIGKMAGEAIGFEYLPTLLSSLIINTIVNLFLSHFYLELKKC